MLFLINSGANSRRNSANLTLANADKQLAHELYLKGRYEWSQRTPESLSRALDDFTQAIVHDPNSAEAYAGLADTYNFQRIFSTLRPGDMYPRALAAARRAVELDDSLAEGHRALAFADVWGERNYPEGYREFRRAIELNPRDPLAHLWFANALEMGIRFPWKMPWDKGYQEMFQDSLEEMSKAQELDPGSHSILANKGIVLYMAGRKDEGAKLLEQVERADPGLATVHTYLSVVEFDRRNYPAYLAESEKSAQLHNDPALRELTGAERAGYAQGGERGLLKALFLKAESCDPATEKPRVMRAYDCVQHGENQEALQLLEEASANHDPYLDEWLSPEALPGWKAIRDEPRFQALVKKINLSQAPGRAPARPGSEAALTPLQPADSSH
jgi:tetratricopeptide (TPR) repeat protein